MFPLTSIFYFNLHTNFHRTACREFVLFFSVMDEGSSLLFWRNLIDFLPNMAGGVNSTTLTEPSYNEATGVSFLSLLYVSCTAFSSVRAPNPPFARTSKQALTRQCPSGLSYLHSCVQGESTTTTSTDAALQALIVDSMFTEANMMYSINGERNCKLML